MKALPLTKSQIPKTKDQRPHISMELNLLSHDELALRLNKVREQMAAAGIESALISSNANLYYLTGRVYSGYIYLPPKGEEPVYFVKRPVHLQGERVVTIRKPENMPEEVQKMGVSLPQAFALELNAVPYAMAVRLCAALGWEEAPLNMSVAMDLARAVKTDHELTLQRISGAKHERVYRKIPQLFQPGMSDIELQIEIERVSRLEGCLGQFRVAGQDMEIYMGNVLAGENADAPSPYDFAMGGAGLDPSLPVGANGTLLKPGMSVMIDMNGDFTGYMTDMTRTFSVGSLAPEAMNAHQVSIEICRELARIGQPGVEARTLYDRAVEMAKDAGLEEFFMGHRQHAGFVGHGVGIEINELPVISPRSKYVLQEHNVIALEPKFVIPGTGAVGIENTYIVTEGTGGMECITRAPQEIISFDR